MTPGEVFILNETSRKCNITRDGLLRYALKQIEEGYQ